MPAQRAAEEEGEVMPGLRDILDAATRLVRLGKEEL